MDDIEHIFQQYRRQLKPYLEMLMHKRVELSEAEWKNHVTQTEINITNSPDQYLTDIPKKEISDSLIHRLFIEFRHESI
jgi:hypothetical protein